MTAAQGTPRTDAALIPNAGYANYQLEQVTKVSRELERENAALSAQVVELQKENAKLAEYKFMYESCSK